MPDTKPRLNRTMLLAAAEVIASVDRENPADLALRKKFVADKPSGEGRRAVTDAVFAYFRWYGWVTRTSSVTRQIQQALDLDEEFQAKPTKFTEQELAPRAVPGWTRGHMGRPLAWLRELQTKPRLWIRARPGKGAELAASLNNCKAGPFPDSLEYKGGED